MRNRVFIARASHFFPFLEVLGSNGIPYERKLRRFGLPTLGTEQSDEYVVVPAVDRFISHIVDQAGLIDLPKLVTERIRYNQLSQQVLAAIDHCPTTWSRLGLFGELMPLECNEFRCRFVQQGDLTRFCVDIQNYAGMPESRYTEWNTAMIVVTIVRDKLGQDWLPTEVGLRTSHQLPVESIGEFAGCKVSYGQHCIYVTAPTQDLARPVSFLDAPHSTSSESDTKTLNEDEYLGLPGSLKMALRPHLRNGIPTVGLAAEICETSPRTMQRELQKSGSSFRQIRAELQFELAADLLRDPTLKIGDIGREVGFDDPSHFVRSFRRISGTTPTEYRRASICE